MKPKINDVYITVTGAVVLIKQTKPYILTNMEWVQVQSYFDHKVIYTGELFINMRYKDNGECSGMPFSNLYKKIGVL